MNASSRAEANSNRLFLNVFCVQVRIVHTEKCTGQDRGDLGGTGCGGQPFWMLQERVWDQRVMPPKWAAEE